jgi:hypothetical protein
MSWLFNWRPAIVEGTEKTADDFPLDREAEPETGRRAATWLLDERNLYSLSIEYYFISLSK